MSKKSTFPVVNRNEWKKMYMDIGWKLLSCVTFGFVSVNWWYSKGILRYFHLDCISYEEITRIAPLGLMYICVQWETRNPYKPNLVFSVNCIFAYGYWNGGHSNKLFETGENWYKFWFFNHMLTHQLVIVINARGDFNAIHYATLHMFRKSDRLHQSLRGAQILRTGFQ